MGVGENTTLFCQRIHVRRDDFGMAAEEAGPVIEIVDTDHQDVGSGCPGTGFRDGEKRNDGNGNRWD